MQNDQLEQYAQASEWTLDKIRGAAGALDAETPCDAWDVRQLMNHMLETQQYFVRSARGEQVQPPSSDQPPTLIGDDPVREFERARSETMQTFGEPGVLEKTGPAIRIATADQLIHGWDLAKATGQDTTMPDRLAEMAYETVHGGFNDEQRKGMFKPEVAVADTASAQDKLLAYTGRVPSS